MKKLIFLFAATVLSLTSCSKDDDNNGNGNGTGTETGTPPAGTKLTKSIVTTALPSGTISKVNYTFDGTKVATVSSSNTSKTVYTYKDNVLSKTEAQENDATISYVVYTFDKDIKNETSFKKVANKADEKTQSVDYTYDEAAKTQTATTTTYADGIATLSKTVIVNTYDGKNLVKTTTTNTVSDKTYTVTTILYKYDDKNNPMVNVTGRPASIVKGSNNYTVVDTTVVVTTEGVAATPEATQSTYSYDYDGAGFPTLVKFVTGGKLTTSAEYNYFN